MSFSQFLASAPEAVREFRTLEIYHPDFSETLRFVKDFVDQSLTLESTAPRNPGQTVVFTALSMQVTEPQESDGSESLLAVKLGAVGNEVQDHISQIVDTLEPIQVIYRKYYSGDTSEPVTVLSLAVSSLSFNSYESVSFTCEDVDFANKNSGILYTTETFVLLRNA